MACRITCLSDDSSDDSVGRGLARFAPACDEPHPKKARVVAPRVLALSDDDQDELVPLVKPMPMSAGRKRPFVEVFAGSQHLSDTFHGNGHRVFPMDVKISIDHDMHGASGQVLLLRQLGLLERETGLKPYVHFAPPCNTYSQARYPRIRSVTHPHGLPPSVLTNHDKAVLKHANRITPDVPHQGVQVLGQQVWRGPHQRGLLHVWHAVPQAHNVVGITGRLLGRTLTHLPWEPSACRHPQRLELQQGEPAGYLSWLLSIPVRVMF